MKILIITLFSSIILMSCKKEKYEKEEKIVLFNDTTKINTIQTLIK